MAEDRPLKLTYEQIVENIERFETPDEVTLQINKINLQLLENVWQLSRGENRKDVGLFKKLRGDYNPTSSKLLYDTLEFMHKFSAHYKPEIFLSELVITLGGYTMYLQDRMTHTKSSSVRETHKQLTNLLFDLKLEDLNKTAIDLLKDMDPKIQSYTVALMEEIASDITKYRKSERYKNKSGPIGMNSALENTFKAIRYREDFEDLSPVQGRPIGPLTKKHLEFALREEVTKAYEQNHQAQTEVDQKIPLEEKSQKSSATTNTTGQFKEWKEEYQEAVKANKAEAEAEEPSSLSRLGGSDS